MVERHPLHWNFLIVSSVFLLLTSALVLSNGLDEASIFLALRVSSLTTALPFLLMFARRPLQRFRATRSTGQWGVRYHAELWVIAAVSHLIHLGQIGLYYTLGQSCSGLTWMVTVPLWLVLVLFAGMAISNPLKFEAMSSSSSGSPMAVFYQVGSWYVWLVFAVAFILGSSAHHLLFYNLPAATLFVAAAIIRVLPQRMQSAQ